MDRVLRGNHHLCVPAGKPSGQRAGASPKCCTPRQGRTPSEPQSAPPCSTHHCLTPAWSLTSPSASFPGAGTARSLHFATPAPAGESCGRSGQAPRPVSSVLPLGSHLSTGRWPGSLQTSAPPRRRRRPSGWSGSAAGPSSTVGSRAERLPSAPAARPAGIPSLSGLQTPFPFAL